MTQRERFEKWARENDLPLGQMSHSDAYVYAHVEWAWLAWSEAESIKELH